MVREWTHSHYLGAYYILGRLPRQPLSTHLMKISLWPPMADSNCDQTSNQTQFSHNSGKHSSWKGAAMGWNHYLLIFWVYYATYPGSHPDCSKFRPKVKRHGHALAFSFRLRFARVNTPVTSSIFLQRIIWGRKLRRIKSQNGWCKVI